MTLNNKPCDTRNSANLRTQISRNFLEHKNEATKHDCALFSLVLILQNCAVFLLCFVHNRPLCLQLHKAVKPRHQMQKLIMTFSKYKRSYVDCSGLFWQVKHSIRRFMITVICWCNASLWHSFVYSVTLNHQKLIKTCQLLANSRYLQAFCASLQYHIYTTTYPQNSEFEK